MRDGFRFDIPGSECRRGCRPSTHTACLVNWRTYKLRPELSWNPASRFCTHRWCLVWRKSRLGATIYACRRVGVSVGRTSSKSKDFEIFFGSVKSLGRTQCSATQHPSIQLYTQAKYRRFKSRFTVSDVVRMIQTHFSYVFGATSEITSDEMYTQWTDHRHEARSDESFLVLHSEETSQSL